MKPLYIKSATAISPQQTFGKQKFADTIITSDNNKLHIIDADYAKYISPVAIRRMSRLLKMGISAGMQCLADAGITQPDAIITGTARGSVADMEHFLKDMITLNEEALNPTYFIQSTYNSVNGWLAMQTKAQCYNQTYVHRGFSFELALFDAWLMIQEAANACHCLVGGFDELTDEYYTIKSKHDYWKGELINSGKLFSHVATRGTIAGEGAAFFTVTNQPDNAICAIHDLQMLQEPANEEMINTIDTMLHKAEIKREQIDVLLCGINGDKGVQPFYEHIISCMPAQTPVAAFKHLCGEYDTAGAFGLWAAAQIFKQQQLPQALTYRQGTHAHINNILLVNYSLYHNASVILLRG